MDLIYELYRKLAHTKTLFGDFDLKPDNSMKNIYHLSEKGGKIIITEKQTT